MIVLPEALPPVAGAMSLCKGTLNRVSCCEHHQAFVLKRLKKKKQKTTALISVLFRMTVLVYTVQMPAVFLEWYLPGLLCCKCVVLLTSVLFIHSVQEAVSLANAAG